MHFEQAFGIQRKYTATRNLFSKLRVRTDTLHTRTSCSSLDGIWQLEGIKGPPCPGSANPAASALFHPLSVLNSRPLNILPFLNTFYSSLQGFVQAFPSAPKPSSLFFNRLTHTLCPRLPLHVPSSQKLALSLKSKLSC